MRITREHRAYAEALRARFSLDSDGYAVPHRAPVGFRKIGEGSTRFVYRGPDGMVYKVTEQEDNLVESANYRRCRRLSLPRNWLLAPAWMVLRETDDNPISVMLMPFIKGKHEYTHWSCEKSCTIANCVVQDADDIANRIGIVDLHYGNYICTGTNRVVIDYAI